MGLLDGYADSIERNALSAARRGMAEPAPEPSFSAGAAVASIGQAAPAGLLEGFGVIRDFSSAIDQRHAEEVKAREKRLGLNPTSPYIIPGGGAARKKADEFAPDPLTAHAAQQITFGFAKSLTKAGAAMALAGPTGGAAIFGLAEADDVAQRLQDKGIDSGTAWQVGGVVGALGAVGVRLPISGAAMAATAGGKVAATAALGVAGGPVSYMAQEGAAREILQRAGHADEAKLHDPLNPIGLAASMFPLAIGAVAVRSAIKRMPATTAADVVMAMESGGKRYGKDGALLTSPKGAQGEMQVMPGTATDPGFGVAPARDAGPDELARVGRDYLAAMEKRYGNTDQAMAAYNAGPGAVDAAIKKGGADWLKSLPAETRNYVAKGRKALDENATEQVRANPEVVDAARVTVLDQTVARSLPDHPMAHAEMLRAADMVGAGERGEVEHMIAPAEREANFKAWFGDSKVVGEDGKPLVMYHGTAFDFDTLRAQSEVAGQNGNLGIYFSPDPKYAEKFAARYDETARVTTDIGGNVMPVYVRMENPKRTTDQLESGIVTAQQVERLRAQGYDGIINTASGEHVAFDSKQVKSATGNSGRFDPNSASLTDPLPQRPNAPNPAQAANLYGKDGALLTSPKGAQGEMQVMPGTATDPGFGVAPAEREANFKAWFGESKVVGEDGAPLVMYHASEGEFHGFDTSNGRFIFMSPDPKFGGEAPIPHGTTVYGLHVKAVNPFDFTVPAQVDRLVSKVLESDSKIDAGRLRESISAKENWIPMERQDVQSAIKALGHDSFFVGENGVKNLAVYDSKQVKSATGNSGRFDPTSASLTDPLPQRPNAPNPAQAANLEAAAPARGAGEAPGAGAADAGRPAADVQAAGVGERHASAEQQAAQALAEQHPDMPVRLPGDEKNTTLAAALERIRDEQAHAAQEGELYRVAVQCALTAGAATP